MQWGPRVMALSARYSERIHSANVDSRWPATPFLEYAFWLREFLSGNLFESVRSSFRCYVESIVYFKESFGVENRKDDKIMILYTLSLHIPSSARFSDTRFIELAFYLDYIFKVKLLFSIQVVFWLTPGIATGNFEGDHFFGQQSTSLRVKCLNQLSLFHLNLSSEGEGCFLVLPMRYYHIIWLNKSSSYVIN